MYQPKQEFENGNRMRSRGIIERMKRVFEHAFVFMLSGLTSYDFTLADLILIGRFVIAPTIIVVFLIHKFCKERKAVDNVEKFLQNQERLMPKRYSYNDLIAMTNHFKDKLGKGGFGAVYKGQLPGGYFIAVKMLENAKFSAEEFISEVSTIGRIHHVNVVQLVGFCSEGSKRALVYEFMPNGSLDKHIFSGQGKGQSFSWEKLLEIALGTARGIEYLHNGCDDCILHLDIKPHNILLDQNYIPKVADFGLAKLYPKENDFVSVSTTRGTVGYIAPELISRNFGSVSTKTDVYSFGMVLLEMAGERKNADAKAKSSSDAYFPAWIYDHLETGDLGLENVTESQIGIARKLCTIGLWCIQMQGSARPSMTKVIELLEGSTYDLKMPPRPFSSSPQLFFIDEPVSDTLGPSTESISESMEDCLHGSRGRIIIDEEHPGGNEKETWRKVEKFLANYKTLNPTSYTFSEIKKMTGRFNHRIGQGGHGSGYQGKLPSGIPIAVKMLENAEGSGE
ncbi:hypothetical protein RJ639_030547 [Escallonia herrerae]|uniref:Protein kinase domain-containing protein n=1 Tax=Escallonia herrerae TaxID=1293975 RepID=A0AA88WYP4_9ASTE|nr:hypothetical protein RJ639_030547 [Escallonia herrerae]